MLVSYDDVYRLSNDGGATWQGADVPFADMGAPENGVVPVWSTGDEAATFDLRTNTAGPTLSRPTGQILDGRGHRLLESFYDSATGVSTRFVFDVSTGERGPDPPEAFDARALTSTGAIGFLEDAGATGHLAVADSTGAVTVIDSAVAQNYEQMVRTVGDLAYFSYVDESGVFRTCVRDLSLPKSNCSAQPLWSYWSGIGTVTTAGVLVAGPPFDDHTDLWTGSWYPVTGGVLGAGVQLSEGLWHPADAQVSGLPLLSTRDLSGSYLLQVASDGSMTRKATLTWAKAAVAPGSLTLTPTSVVGSDMRNWIMTDWEDESYEHQTAWRRSTTGSSLGPEEVLTSLGRGYPLASGARVVEPFDDGDDDTPGTVTIRDGQSVTHFSFQYFEGRALSGPYLLASWTNEDFGGEDFGTGVWMPNDEWRSFPDGVALFGSLLLEQSEDTGNYTVTDLTGANAPISFTLDGFDSQGVGFIWGDWVGASRHDNDANDYVSVVHNFRTGQSLNQPGRLDALGDGLAAVSVDDDGPDKLWNLTTNTVTAGLLGDQESSIAIDGDRVAYATDTQLVVKKIDGVTLSTPRNLGVVAPASLDLSKDTSWSADIDLTKPVQAGQLQVKDSAGTVVRSVAVPASPDGSLRGILWDGKNDTGTYVPSGTYSYALTSQATDGSGVVKAVDGTDRALGQIAVTGGLSYAVPTISGTAAIGQTLTVVPGTWGPDGVQLSYQWLRNGVAINGATGGSYVVQSSDAGATLSVAVTGTLSGYATSVVVSAATATVPGAGQLTLTGTPTPTISGAAKVGSTLTASAGTWAPAPVSLVYQWLRAGSVIPDATQSTYTLTGDDAGATIQVAVTGSKDGYQSVTKTSKATAKVANGVLSPRPTPSVSGTAMVDQTLTAASDPWGPGTVDLSYQWYRVSSSGKASLLAGKTGSTYQVQGADAGGRLKVRVTGSAKGYDSASVYSKTTAKVAKASFASVAAPSVSVSGTPRVGKTVTATPGTASPVGTSWSYQWYRVSAKGKVSAIKKATTPAYLLSASDLGSQVKVKVTTNRAGYTASTAESALTAKVDAGLSGAKPKLSDTSPTVGQSLSVTDATGIGMWSPQPVTAGFQWLRDGKTVVGADATYTVQAADAGHRLSVRLTGTREDYAPLVLTSSSSSKVAKASFATKGVVAITVSGTVLTAAEGAWVPSPDSYGYQWYRNGKAISKATNKTYDHGTATGDYKVQVTAIKAGYNTATSSSPLLKA